jgi:signal transduction histidine kinase
MKKFSLNKRLVFAALGSQILLAAGLVIVGTTFSRHYIRSAFDVYVQGRAQSIAALVYFRDDGIPGLLFNDEKVPVSPHRLHKEIFVVKSDRDNLERHTPGFDPRMFDAIPSGARFWNFTSKGEPYRAIVLRNVAILDTEEGEPLPLPRLTVIYAAPTMDIEHELRNLGIAIGMVSLLILLPTLWLAVWSIRRALAPLNELATAASTISVDSWRFEPSAEARCAQELEPLIQAMQTVLAGLESAFTHQREFLGDAAHELKTSLAILKSTVQAQLARPRERDDYVQGLNTMSGDCDRLERLLNRMLQTARAEQRIATGRRSEPDPVDLDSTCEAAIARLAQFASEREIAIDFVSDGEAMVRAEAADLELLWLNLLENALQYSPRGSQVSMHLTTTDEVATVTVSDRGCGIEAVHLPHIFQRFYRADSSRARTTGGFGLGLAMAKSLVDLYRGHIQAESEPGQGTRITVELPVDTTSAEDDRGAQMPASATQ